MELWIRTQNKQTLLSVNNISCDESCIFTKIMPTDKHGILGKYKTKERALEVLDEIQDLFIKQHISESVINQDGITFNTEQLNSIVYEMPKE